MKKMILSAIVATGILSATTMNAQTTMNIDKTPPVVDLNGTADDLNNTGVVGISGWEAFNKLSVHMYDLEGANYYTTIRVMRDLKPTVASLASTKPMWMNTEEINEDIADFVKDFNELTSEKSADNEEFRENLEEIVEQYEDLREEAKEVFVAYRDNVQDGNAEWKEEIEKDRSTKENMKDGYEEYKEELKDNKDIRDGKKMKSKQ